VTGTLISLPSLTKNKVLRNQLQDQLPAFLKTAERLKVKGLAEAPQNIKQE
jgi:hypothetical protein